MQGKSKGSATAMKAVCAALFVVFVISYVFFYQCDVLAMTQYAWSDGLKHYDRIVGGVVITSVVFAVAVLTAMFSRLPLRFHTLCYFPSLILLGMLTAVRQEGSSVHGAWGWLAFGFLMLIIAVFSMRAAVSYKAYLQPLRAHSFLSHPWWINGLLFFLQILTVYAMGNNDRTLHTRLAVERYVSQRQYDMALRQGFPQYDNDSALTMLRAMALANTYDRDSVCQLGECLFKYEITGGSRSLIAHSDKSNAFLLGSGYGLWQTIGFVPFNRDEHPVVMIGRQLQRERMRQVVYNDTLLSREKRDSVAKPVCSKVAKDYLLCAYLLDRDLKGFAKALPSYYALNDSLPQHYREACVLYGRIMDKTLYHDTSVEADYDDFLSVMRVNKNSQLRRSALRDSFFGTYWYYYYMGSGAARH